MKVLEHSDCGCTLISDGDIDYNVWCPEHGTIAGAWPEFNGISLPANGEEPVLPKQPIEVCCFSA